MSASNDRDILNIDEAAQLLGVSVKTFNKVLHTQNLPARKIGREWKFSRRHLIEWVGSGDSADFYRESSGSAPVQELRPSQPQPRGSAPAAQSSNGGSSKQPSDAARRTSGWRLELD